MSLRVVVLAMLTLILWAAWTFFPRLSSSRAPAQPAGVAASAASDAESVVPRSTAASRTPAPVTSVPVVDERADLARRMKADWCGFGINERDRQRAAVYERAIAASGAISMEVIAELRETVGGELIEEATADVLHRWVAVLMQRGDVRSLAVADYLVADSDARARLQMRARTSSDPMVTVLALHRPCAAGDCINIEAAQWSRLEPDNLQAWLALLSSQAGQAVPTQTAYVMDRAAVEARHSRSYQLEVYALLTSMPQAATLGLQNEAEIQLMVATVYGWPVLNIRAFMGTCRNGLADNMGMAERCEAVARLLWQQDDMISRALSMSIARALVAAQPSRRALWEPQARAFEATQALRSMAAKRAANQPEPASLSCGGQAETRKMLQDYATHSEWGRLREDMREAGEDETALSARWRKEQGRSVLDPLPTSPAPVRPR